MNVPPRRFDVVVIGAGIVGSAIARELAGYDLAVAIVEAGADVGEGTSKANTAIVHTGFDATPGTLESRLVARGHGLLTAYAAQSGIAIDPIGAVLVAWSDDELAALPGLAAKAQANGYQRAELLSAAQVYQQLPNLGSGVRGGLSVPDESITCTWSVNLGLATDAVNRGVELLCKHRVVEINTVGDGVNLRFADGRTLATRWVVNAAGLGSAEIDRCFGFQRFTVIPRRGQLVVYDKLARPLVNKIVLPVPTKLGKGVLVSPTIYGNVMVGPTAEPLAPQAGTAAADVPSGSATTTAGLDYLLATGRRLVPALGGEEVTACYAGVRAAIEYPTQEGGVGDGYLIETDPDLGYVLVAGIRSTGLTAGLAVAEHVRDLMAESGLPLKPRSELPPIARMPNLGETARRPYQDHQRIVADPAYGQVVCFCERVSAGEIRDAYTSVIPPASPDGLRRRTRAMNGRCQGFYCAASVAELSRRYG